MSFIHSGFEGSIAGDINSPAPLSATELWEQLIVSRGHGNVDGFEAALDRIPVQEQKRIINKIDQRQRTLLHWAARYGLLAMVRLLVTRGANVNGEAKDQSRPLHLACGNGHHAVASLLLAHGAEVNARTRHHTTALHTASLEGRLALVETLIEHGADVTAENQSQDTPLHWACHFGHKDIFHVLVDNGANVNARNDMGNTPLHAACCTDRLDIARELLQNGADVNAVRHDRRTPFAMALRDNAASCASILMENGAEAIMAYQTQSNTWSPELQRLHRRWMLEHEWQPEDCWRYELALGRDDPSSLSTIATLQAILNETSYQFEIQSPWALIVKWDYQWSRLG
eukprot:TRINITY_DN11476_c1_g2_i5.p2 TRINITY_DN11476_c1_g2~~TRINITY_DN11476_c1_g2_i5.p2  ORF type:complete len:343 (+),score=36.87 TRINITY_DN11476_c1_g2_i5:1246-2274(+)